MIRTSWIPLLLLFVASAASGTVFTQDGVIGLDDAQILGSSDGEHLGKAWGGTLEFPAPITIENGDTLQGTVAFGSTLLRVRDDGGGFFKVGMTTGFEQLIAIATDPASPVRTSQEVDKAVFTDARGPSVEMGDSRLVFASHNGLFMQVVENFVDAGDEILVSGIDYRLTLVLGGPFTFSDIDFRVLAEDLAVVAREPGDLAYRTCITGETESGPEESDACRITDGVAPGGIHSGLNNVRAIAVSPDGKSVYTVSGSDDAIARFDRDVLTNVLTYRDCASGDTAPGPDGSGACTETPGAQAGGVHSGLDFPQGLAVSPDGKSVYVASAGDDAVTRFDRDVDTGALTFGDCISGDSDADDACLLAPATPTGADSGMDGLRAIVVSADGKSAYAVATDDDSVVRFERDPENGLLTSLGCISGEIESDNCGWIPGATSQGHDSGLDAPFGLALSPDGTSLYVVSRDDDAVARFTRDPETGALAYVDCISGESASACTHVPSATADGVNSGLDELYTVAVSPDGASVYAVSERDDAVVRFTRDVDTGALTYEGCISGETESAPACTLIPSATSDGADSGLDKLRSVAVTADGASVYVASPADDAMARFDRDRETGALTYVGCMSAELQTTAGACDRIGSATTNGTSSGVDNPQAFALSPDGIAAYAASANDAAVARFDREPFPPTTTTTTTTVPDTTTTTTSTLPGSTIVTTTSTTSTSSTTTSTTVPPTRISGQQLLITDNRDATKRKIVFVSTDAHIDPTAFDPSTEGAFLQVFNDADGDDDACVSLPARGWSSTVKRGKTTLKYADPQSAAGPCKMVVAKSGKLTLTCVAKTKPIDYSLDEPSQTRVAVRFTSGDTTYCAVFGGTVTKDKTGKKFAAKDATAPAACPTPPASCR